MPKKTLIASLIIPSLLIYLLIYFFSPNQNQPNNASTLQRVAVETLEAEKLSPTLELHGYAKAYATVNVIAETKGQILDFHVSEGETVKKGTVLATLSIEDRKQALQEAEARLKQARKVFEIEKKLAEEDFSSELSTLQAKANLESAEATLIRIKKDFNNTKLLAPFDGIVLRKLYDQGNTLRGGEPVIEFADLKKLKVAVFVAEKDYPHIHKSNQATILFDNHPPQKGKITFVSRSADPKTRTYAVEVLIDNKEEKIPDGMTALVKIPTQLLSVYKINPSALTLNEEGALGIKVVDGNNQVKFYPTTYVQSENDKIWVTGLPEKIRLIKYGGDFVPEGAKVEFSEMKKSS